MSDKKEDKLHIIEMEYSELNSIPPYKNIKFGLRIKKTAKTYDEDFAALVIEVKSRLQQLSPPKRKAETSQEVQQ